MITVRQKLLDYIIEQRVVTTAELSKVFQLTPANIRHHLSILLQQGSIKFIKNKSSGQKGRPAKIYTPTQLDDQNNLDRLSAALLNLYSKSKKSTDKNQMISELAEKISSEFKIDTSNPTRRLYATIESLNSMYYQAHWEAHVENPRIMFSHCPYRAVLDDHPELCMMDSALLESFLSMPVTQVEKLALNLDGLTECVFLINHRR